MQLQLSSANSDGGLDKDEDDSNENDVDSLGKSLTLTIHGPLADRRDPAPSVRPRRNFSYHMGSNIPSLGSSTTKCGNILAPKTVQSACIPCSG
jgi:hypothetical protein